MRTPVFGSVTAYEPERRSTASRAASSPMKGRQTSAWTRKDHSDVIEVGVVSLGKLFVGATSCEAGQHGTARCKSSAARGCPEKIQRMQASRATRTHNSPVDGHLEPVRPKRIDLVHASNHVLAIFSLAY